MDEESKRLATALKEEGNMLFLANRIKQSVEKYDAAIAILSGEKQEAATLLLALGKAYKDSKGLEDKALRCAIAAYAISKTINKKLAALLLAASCFLQDGNEAAAHAIAKVASLYDVEKKKQSEIATIMAKSDWPISMSQALALICKECKEPLISAELASTPQQPKEKKTVALSQYIADARGRYLTQLAKLPYLDLLAALLSNKAACYLKMAEIEEEKDEEENKFHNYIPNTTTKRFEEVLLLSMASLALNCGNPKAHYRCAMALFKGVPHGGKEIAKSICEMGLANLPDNPDWMNLMKEITDSSIKTVKQHKEPISREDAFAMEIEALSKEIKKLRIANNKPQKKRSVTLESRAPPIHTEFENEGDWPENVDKKLCISVLEYGYELARDILANEKFLLSESNKIPMGMLDKRLGGTITTSPYAAAIFDWWKSATPSDTINPSIRFLPRLYNSAPCNSESPQSSLFRSFGKAPIPPDVLELGTCHVAIGFTDLGTLLAASFKEDEEKKKTKTKAKTKTKTKKKLLPKKEC